MKYSKLFLILSIPALVWIGFVSSSRFSRYRQLSKGENLVEKAIQEDASQRFTPLTRESIATAANRAVNSLSATNQLDLSPQQIHALENKMLALFASHSLGDPRAYFDLVCPVTDVNPDWMKPEYELVLRTVVTDLQKGLLDRQGSLPGDLGKPIAPDSDLRALQAIRGKLMSHVYPGGTNKTWCSECWEGAAFDQLQLEAARTPYPPDRLEERASMTGQRRYRNHKMNSLIHPTLAETLVIHESVTAVTISFLVKTKPVVEHIRYFCRFYYSPENQDWILTDFATGDGPSQFYYEIL
jgi:hypothetical protein